MSLFRIVSHIGHDRVRIIHGLTLVIKNSYTYYKGYLALEAKYYYACPKRDRLVGKNSIARPRLPLIRKTLKRAHHATNLSHNFYHTCMLRDLPISTKVFLNFIITH